MNHFNIDFKKYVVGTPRKYSYKYEILRNGIRVRGKTNKTYISKERAAEQASIDFYTKYKKKTTLIEQPINQENNEMPSIKLTTTLNDGLNSINDEHKKEDILFVDLVNEFKENYKSSGKSAGSIQNVFGYIDNYIYSSLEKDEKREWQSRDIPKRFALIEYEEIKRLKVRDITSEMIRKHQDRVFSLNISDSVKNRVRNWLFKILEYSRIEYGNIEAKIYTNHLNKLRKSATKPEYSTSIDFYSLVEKDKDGAIENFGGDDDIWTYEEYLLFLNQIKYKGLYGKKRKNDGEAIQDFWFLVFTTLLNTGMRVGEFRALQVSDFDPKGYISITKTINRYNKVKKFKEDDDLKFDRYNGPKTPESRRVIKIPQKLTEEIAILKNFKGGYTFKYQHSTIK